MNGQDQNKNIDIVMRNRLRYVFSFLEQVKPRFTTTSRAITNKSEKILPKYEIITGSIMSIFFFLKNQSFSKYLKCA